MLMFAIASVLCILAPNIYIFNLMRLFQGLAGAGGIVISKSMSTDMYSGKELANFMAILGSINGIAPVCAPVIGGLMAGVTNWQGVFGLLLGIGIILMFCSARLPETLTPEKRIQKSIIQVYANLFRVFRNRIFTLSTWQKWHVSSPSSPTSVHRHSSCSRFMVCHLSISVSALR